MARTFADMILETSQTLGNGLYELQGPAIGYRAFRDSYVTGDQPYYVVRNHLDTKFEINRGGTYTNAGVGTATLTRNVLYSSNANGAVLWQVDDLPLAVYCPRSAETDEGHITGWLAAVRNAMIRYGLWWKKDTPAVGKNQLTVFDGTVDIPFISIDTTTHLLTLDPNLGGASVIASDTPPVTPGKSQLWFNTAQASLYLWYDDGNTIQWVPAMPIPAPGQPGTSRIKTTRFNASGNFFTDANMLYCEVTCKGGGGGSGAFSTDPSYASGCAGGGEGAITKKRYNKGELAPGVSVSIGGGGSATVTGFTTSFGSQTALGGGPGLNYTRGGFGGNDGANYDELIPGAPGGSGQINTNGWIVNSGHGGGSGGGPSVSAGGGVTSGISGIANSGGGGSGDSSRSAGPGGIAGGSGGSGYVTVVEYLKAVV